MINFPIFDRVDIEGYGLFPGNQESEPGLHIRFQPGLTMILGANGLGKTTLVTILYRLLTGPYDIPGLSDVESLGTVSLQAKQLPFSVRTTFKQRVMDGARNAKARLHFSLGNREVMVERRLSDLALIQFSVDDQKFETDEDLYCVELSKLVGVSSFGDWILLLRYLVFYFEDRRALVWDASAQRQILRFLLLPAETAREWTNDERAILELDSSYRNLRAVVSREERRVADTQVMLQQGADIRAELEALESMQQVDDDRHERLSSELLQIDARRQAARLRMLKAQQEREARYRSVERAKLTAIEARFPERSDTARYILAQLITEAECLVCGNRVPQVAATLEERIERAQCLVCGSELSDSEQHVSAATLADHRVEKVVSELAAIEPELAEAQRQFMEVEAEHAAVAGEIDILRVTISERSARIDSLVRRLPPAEAEVHGQQSALATMRTHLGALRNELDEKRIAFTAFVREVSRTIVERSEDIQASFARYAEGFLIEGCRLIWSPQGASVGQTGSQIKFPAFELEMTGADFPSPVRRSKAEQVSESQREFIDLAFRMSLIEVAGTGGVGSLVIDAPESSLDAVFVARAAHVLARFADPERGNRLVVTSNLTEGKLVPMLLTQTSSTVDRFDRLIDLFQLAVPTAAIRELRDEYGSFRDLLVANITMNHSGDAASSEATSKGMPT